MPRHEYVAAEPTVVVVPPGPVPARVGRQDSLEQRPTVFVEVGASRRPVDGVHTGNPNDERRSVHPGSCSQTRAIVCTAPPPERSRPQGPTFALISTPKAPAFLLGHVAVTPGRSTAHSANRSPTVLSPEGCWSMVAKPLPGAITAVAFATPKAP